MSSKHLFLYNIFRKGRLKLDDISYLSNDNTKNK